MLSAPTLLLCLSVLVLSPELFTRANVLFILNNLVLAAFAVYLFARAIIKSYPYARILALGFALLLFGAASFLFFSDSKLTGAGFFILSSFYPLAERFGISRLSLDLVSYALNLIGLTVFSAIFFIDAPKLERPSPALIEASGQERSRATCEAMGLSPREIEVALLALGGKRNKEIAEALFVSENTVKTHLARIFAKAGVKARSELFAIFAKS
jgi:DNA-binding CsgD family transcriptional regulator